MCWEPNAIFFLLFSILLLLFTITLLPSALLASVHGPGGRLAVPTGGWHGVAGCTACAQRGSSLHVSHSPSVWGPSRKQQRGFEAFESPSIRTSEAFFYGARRGKGPLTQCDSEQRVSALNLSPCLQIKGASAGSEVLED